MITPSYSLSATERVLPRMALDFTTASLDARVTVTRALNTATRTNSSGFIENINADLPRFDYDPLTLVCKGLLIEESRANLARDSKDFSSIYWEPFGTKTVTADQAVAPDNTTTADLLSSPAGNGIYQQINILASTTYTLSVFAKASTSTNVRFSYATTGSNGFVDRAISAGTNVGNGWYRHSYSFTSVVGDSFVIVRIQTGPSDPTPGFYIWGAQLEAGAFATSYIPTTTTSLTRNTDAVQMTGTNFSSWYNADAGSFVSRYTLLALITTASQELLNMTDGTLSNVITVTANNTAGSIGATATTAGTGQGFINIAGVAANTIQTSAYRYGLNNSAIAFNASAPVVDTTYNVPTGLNILSIGSRINTFGTINGHIQRFFYYPQSLTNAELTAFSK